MGVELPHQVAPRAVQVLGLLRDTQLLAQLAQAGARPFGVHSRAQLSHTSHEQAALLLELKPTTLNEKIKRLGIRYRG